MDSPHALQCSEVWGGNDEVDRSVVMQGLDAWVVSRPHAGDALGGDIHYLSSCATGRITRLLIADVAGHGRSVAEIAARLRTLMRRHVNHADQTRLTQLINREFSQDAQPGRFATAVVATYWGPTGDLDITIAGHPPPLLFTAATGRWQLLRPEPDAAEGDIPLGILDETNYTRRRLTLARGDALLLYTDALFEARNPAGELLGVDGLLRLVTRAAPFPSEQTAPAILAAVRDFTGGSDPDDDVTILLVRPNNLRPARGSLATGLSATWRVAKGALAGVGRGELPLPDFSLRNLMGVWLDRFNR